MYVILHSAHWHELTVGGSFSTHPHVQATLDFEKPQVLDLLYIWLHIKDASNIATNRSFVFWGSLAARPQGLDTGASKSNSAVSQPRGRLPMARLPVGGSFYLIPYIYA